MSRCVVCVVCWSRAFAVFTHIYIVSENLAWMDRVIFLWLKPTGPVSGVQH